MTREASIVSSIRRSMAQLACAAFEMVLESSVRALAERECAREQGSIVLSWRAPVSGIQIVYKSIPVFKGRISRRGIFTID
jgi:hypothetical protein